MNRDVFPISPGASYALIDGRTLLAHLDADEGGLAFATPAGTTEYVLRDAHSGGRFCRALVERRWRGAPGRLTAVYVPTGFTLDDLVKLQS